MYVQFISGRDITGEATKETGGTTELITRAVLQHRSLYRKAIGIPQLYILSDGCTLLPEASESAIPGPGCKTGVKR
jgi:hypothetical protein